ncbi:MAG: IS200/IS605 family accessory protein TnpB-related protein [Xenococcaceae cyanobacterium MO_207.B15]|nr:IS200/IS605 family accessory protein TnpB-related protein [Xenococcaceae cyanobacterium MO_207.B15]
MPTYQTLLSPSIYPFLESMACLYSAIEKQMHVALLGGDRIADIEKQLQNKFQVDSTTIRNVYHNLKGKHSGIKELHKRRAKELKSTISSIKKSITARQKRVKIKLKSQQSAKSHRFIIHQKKRRLALLQQKLEKLQGSEINLCFGTKKLFKAQYHLEANGYSNHQEWLADWQAARTSSFVMVGSKTYAGGNQLCRLDIKGNLAITVPTCLIKDYGGKVKIEGVNFRHGQEFIDIALSPTSHKRGKQYRNGTEKPLTHRFVRKNNNWYLHAHVELPDIPTITNRTNGAIGIDLNVNNIAWAYCDSEGNLKDKGQIAIDDKNKSSGQTTHILSLAIAQILEKATTYECPVVIEKLDFGSKKARLRESSQRYARMLSQFAYSKFTELVYSKARLAAIQVIEVNPAYSSLIGMVKFMSLYGLNSGRAASLVLARRGLRLSERLPRICNALVSPVDDTKHVWTYWARISKLLKGCHRHSYFEMKVRVEVKPNNQSPNQDRNLFGKSRTLQ